jgi:hypothetical protein
MIKIVQAPEEIKLKRNSIKLFLAGGISNCPKWQDEICERLSKEKIFDEYDIDIVIFNPRCKSIPEEEAQIKWEYDKLKKSNIHCFWFSEGSLNPITLFEYGSHFKSKNKDLVVGCHMNYPRRNNVIIQTKLELPQFRIVDTLDDFYQNILMSIRDNILIKLDPGL